jgi:LysR family transcriptional activator of nhaA
MNHTTMDRELNYHHLRYFWTVAREGSIAKACGVLHVSQSTISGQLRELEKSLGEPVFSRTGRTLRMTATGRLIKEYCDGIFSLGNELQQVLGGAAGRRSRLVIGIADALSKLMVYRLLAPALQVADPPRLECSEGRTERLVADLATNQLDLVLSDAPLAPGLRIKAYSHLLIECPLAVFAPAGVPALVACRQGFPTSLHDAPLLMPSGSAQRTALDNWLAEGGLVPRIVAECQDGALLKAFGHAGVGLFPGPAAISAEICRMYQAVEIGRIASVPERIWAITLERRLTEPAILAISRAAKRLGR